MSDNLIPSADAATHCGYHIVRHHQTMFLIVVTGFDNEMTYCSCYFYLSRLMLMGILLSRSST